MTLRAGTCVRFVCALALFTVIFTGCLPRDPTEAVLEVRRAWKVDLISFIEREDGAVSAQFRLSGPA